MSGLADEFELSQYKELECLDKKGNVYIVKDIRDNKLWVKKKITKNGFDAYNGIKGIKNDNVVYVKEILCADEKYYVIEEYIDGVDLQRLITEKSPMDFKEVRIIMCQICDGLKFIHDKNIIHRDITPSNIIISNDGIVKLIDMGIARIKKEESNRDTTILGTAGYAAPEQFGFSQTNVTTDIYSCGVLMNVMLTGKFPFEYRYKGNMDYVLEHCIRMEPKERYQTIGELKRALIKSEGKIARLGNVFDKTPGFRTNNNTKKVIAIILYTTVAVFLFFSVFMFPLDFKAGILYLSIGIFTFLLPFLIGANYLNYQEKLPVVKLWRKSARNSFGIAAGLVIFYISVICVIIFYVKD